MSVNVTDFCKRILFSPKIEDKIFGLETDREAQHSSCVKLPPYPARDSRYGFGADHKKKVAFPRINDLESEEVRGQVFHFFANHELLALELMALALLRFPEAPEGFRRGIVATMQEEQKHLTLYLARMRDFGIGFGDLPVNDFFWHCLSEMATPKDFVAGMGLTFEQANLDFAVYYRDLFYQLGDEKSAKIMNLVYQEELGHVKHGLHWFNHFRKGDESLFEEYASSLVPPLSPSRAKGKVMCADARRAVGFDEAFIQSLRLYSDDKYDRGVHILMNTDAELELASGNSYSPSKANIERMDDLAGLGMFWAKPGDCIITDRRPNSSFLLAQQKIGLTVPRFVSPAQIASTAKIKIDAWAPTRKFQFFKDSGFSTFEKLSQKVLVTSLRAYIRESCSFYQSVLGPEIYDGFVACSLAEVLRYRDKLSSKFSMPMCLKPTYGAAGQGLVRVFDGDLSVPQKGWLDSQLKKYGAVLVEPWLPRIFDFSAQLRSDGKLPVKLNRPICDPHGQYLGHVLGPGGHLVCRSGMEYLKRVSSKVSCWLAMEKFAEACGLWLGLHGHKGYAGVDFFVYATPSGFKVQVSEINPRKTMGFVSHMIERRLTYGIPGLFLILSNRHLNSLGLGGYQAIADRWSQSYPVELDKHGRVCSGVFFLSDPSYAKRCLPVAIVGRSVLNSLKTDLTAEFEIIEREDFNETSMEFGNSK